ncbi:MAG: RNA polymerase sporulation sigma factor SigK [Bacilli bacterium]
MFKKIFNYLKELMFFTASYSINVFPTPLSKEETNKNIELLLKGDKSARALLIEHNLRLVAHIVKKYDSFNEDPDDLISIGTIGLIKGIDSFSDKNGAKITTYVAKCIENEILMYFRSNKKNNNNVSLNDTIGFDKDGNEIAFIDVIKGQGEDVNDIVFLKDNINLLKDYIKYLTPREKNVIVMRYGLLGTEELTQKNIASILHISRSYVSRIEKRALVKMLREFIKNNKC